MSDFASTSHGCGGLVDFAQGSQCRVVNAVDTEDSLKLSRRRAGARFGSWGPKLTGAGRVVSSVVWKGVKADEIGMVSDLGGGIVKATATGVESAVGPRLVKPTDTGADSAFGAGRVKAKETGDESAVDFESIDSAGDGVATARDGVENEFCIGIVKPTDVDIESAVVTEDNGTDTETVVEIGAVKPTEKESTSAFGTAGDTPSIGSVAMTSSRALGSLDAANTDLLLMLHGIFGFSLIA